MDRLGTAGREWRPTMHNNITAHDILAELHGKLDKSKRTGDKLMARCPAHDDKTPSLSVTIGDNDCVILKCFAGCPTEDVVAKLGWTMRDLFASDATRPAGRAISAAAGLCARSVKTPRRPRSAPKGLGRERLGRARWRVTCSRRCAAPCGCTRRVTLATKRTRRNERRRGLPRDTPGRVRLWIEALTDADLDAQLRVLHLIAGSGEWQQLDTALRIAVVGAIKGRTEASMATAILGRFDDRKMAWREPPTKAVDTVRAGRGVPGNLTGRSAGPGIDRGARARVRGTMGFIRGPKASGKTTVLAAAAAR